jgi:hypothetical protein
LLQDWNTTGDEFGKTELGLSVQVKKTAWNIYPKHACHAWGVDKKLQPCTEKIYQADDSRSGIIFREKSGIFPDNITIAILLTNQTLIHYISYGDMLHQRFP